MDINAAFSFSDVQEQHNVKISSAGTLTDDVLTKIHSIVQHPY